MCLPAPLKLRHILSDLLEQNQKNNNVFVFFLQEQLQDNQLRYQEMTVPDQGIVPRKNVKMAICHSFLQMKQPRYNLLITEL